METLHGGEMLGSSADDRVVLSFLGMVAAVWLVLRFFLMPDKLGARERSKYEQQLNRGTLRLPPVVPHWIPYFGSWFALERDPQGFLRECQQRYGDYYTLYICGRRYHIVMDHKVHRFYYFTPDSQLRAEGSPFVAVLGAEDTGLFQGIAPSVVLADTAKWLSAFHQHVATGLQGAYIKSYIPYVREDAMGFLGKLMSRGRGWEHLHGVTSFLPSTLQDPEAIDVNMFEAIEEIAIKTNLRMMLDDAYLEKYPHVLPLFYTVKQFFEKWASHPFVKNLILLTPTPQNFRIRNGIKELKRTILEHIDHFYDQGESSTILFTALRQSRVKDLPGGPPRGILITIFLLLITATANAPLTCFWMIYELAKQPALYKKARDEQDAVRDGMRAKGLDPNNPHHWMREHFTQMKYLDACIMETIRIYQGAFHVGNVLRGVFVDQVIDKYVLPAGDLVALPSTRYLDSSVFPDADKFVPERWLDEALVEKHKNDFFAFSPFGHGVHMCPGRAFARIFIKTIAGGFVSKLEVEIPDFSRFEIYNPPFTGIRPPTHGQHHNIVRLRARVRDSLI